MNLSILSGRLATDVTYRLTMKGKPVSNFLLAVPYSFMKGKDGKYPASFIPVTAFGNEAVRCQNYLTKGRQVLVKGHLVENNYTKEGYKNQAGEAVKIHSIELITERIEFLGYRKQFSDGTPMKDNEEFSEEVGAPPLEEMSFPDDIPDEEIPF